MKPALAFITAILVYTSAIAQNIEAKLRSIAQNRYPNDYSMQRFVYDEQKKGYEYMTGVTDTELKNIAEKRYPDDYSMQKFVYDEQKKDKAYMATVTDPEIKRIATQRYPDDYSMQKFVYNEQKKDKGYMNTVTSGETHTPDNYAAPKYVDGDKADKDYMATVPDAEIKDRAEKKYPTNYGMQRFFL